MNETMPPWRSFTSAAPEAVPTPPPAVPAATGRWSPPVMAAVAAAGGLLLGVVAVALAVALSLPAQQAGPVEVFGEPLVSATLGDPLPVARVEAAGISPAGIVVDVSGAVARPGLHRLLDGDRVGDAITAAGGFGPRADLAATSELLNLAQPLADGAKVLVPELGTARGAASAGAGDGRIDVNHADQAELESLPGIGPVTAGRIIAARAEGRFESVADLRSRGLVGESVFADIRDLVTAG